MIDIILKPIFKVIFGIPLWLAIRMARLVQQFVTELFTIMAFRALWYIRVIFWLFVLYGLVLLDPFIKPVLMESELQPAGSWLYDFYNRGLIVIMGLGIAAYATANLRRRFRRVRLEVKFLSEGRSLLNQIGFGKGNNGDKNGKEDGAKPKKPRSRKERKDTTKPVDAKEFDVENADLSMEQLLAAVGAQAQTEVNAMTSGKPLPNERKPWNLGTGKGRHSKSALELEEEAEQLLDDARSRTRRVRGKYKNNPQGDNEKDIFGDDN